MKKRIYKIRLATGGYQIVVWHIEAASLFYAVKRAEEKLAKPSTRKKYIGWSIIGARLIGQLTK